MSVITDQHFNSGAIHVSVVSTRGLRPTMEDHHRVILGNQSNYIAVFDGHGGTHSSKWAAMNLHKFLDSDTDKNIANAFISADGTLFDTVEGDQSGTTVALVKITPIANAWTAVAVHAGDTRVLFITPISFMATRDHKPELPAETARIEAAGGCVKQWFGAGPARVDGELSVSRGLGDFHKKCGQLPITEQKIISVPDVTRVTVTAETRIVICCDGVFERLTNEEVAEEVRRHENCSDAANALTRLALASGSEDNITVAAVYFDKESSQDMTPELTPRQEFNRHMAAIALGAALESDED